jgi:hypothetical protein
LRLGIGQIGGEEARHQEARLDSDYMGRRQVELDYLLSQVGQDGDF